jgi:5-methylcytosine-specific restriction enzyme subunit McrC
MTRRQTSVQLSEWQRCTLKDVRLSPQDQRLASSLSAERRLTVRETVAGLEIEATGWIGVVELQAVSIVIEPRLVAGHLNLLQMLEFVEGVRLFRRFETPAEFDDGGRSLFDLIAWLLADACDAVLKQGLHADYLQRHEDLPVVRGRLDVRAQVLRRWGQIDRLCCDFDERLRDIAENRWLLRALRIARRGVRNAKVATRVKQAASTWDELIDDEPSESLDRPQPTRQTTHYQPALNLAYLVCDGAGIRDLLTRGSMVGFSFLLNMPRLFENFVGALLARIMPPHGISVRQQHRSRTILWSPDSNRPFAQIRPDVLLSKPGHAVLPLDTKYKDYDHDRVSMSDVYQTSIYALTFGMTPGAQLTRCVLLYPSSGRGSQPVPERIHVRAGTRSLAEVVVYPLSIDRVLESVRDGAIDVHSVYVQQLQAFLAGGMSPAAEAAAS